MAENPFDSLKRNTFDVIANTMGYTATWNGITARVLFNDPAVDEEVSEHEYEYGRPTLEYKDGDWAGLRDLIEAKEVQTIEVRGKDYYTLKIIGDGDIAEDGETYKVTLQEVT